MSPRNEVSSNGAVTPRTAGFKYPKGRDASDKGSQRWLEDRREDDGAEGLWRVEDTLYDFSGFVERHPGGAQWLNLTKGTDITEAFESHHISPMPANMLEKFAIRPAKTPRNSPYTFLPDGFYARLRRRVFDILPDMHDRGPSFQSCVLVDVLVFLIFTFATLAASRQSPYLASLAGLLLGINTIASHNFLHMRENMRRFYFDLSLMSNKSWRVSHALSHHLYPNTITDLEISLTEPMLQWLPSKNKTIVSRYISWLYSPIIYAFIFPFEFGRRLILEGVHLTDLIPLTIPAAMLMWTPPGYIIQTLLLYVQLVLTGSLYFTLIGFNAAHHDPSIYHEGDATREDQDWGLAQLDAVRDRPSVSGVEGAWKYGDDGQAIVLIDDDKSHSIWTFLKVMVTFGHHSLHHLFPTVDHANLPQLYPALAETLTEFRVPFRTLSFTQLFMGQLKQLAKNKPNPIPPPYIPIKNNCK